MLKRTGLCIALTGLCSLALAGGMGCQKGDVFIPCKTSNWRLGVDGLYLKNTTSQWSNVDANFSAASGWGYRIHGAYNFSSGRDVKLDWAHFNKATNSSQPQTSKMDVVKLTLGQSSRYANNVDLRFSGGVEYARLVDNSPATTINGDAEGRNERASAVGPVIDLNISFIVAKHWQLYSGASFAQMYNEQKSAPAFKNSITHLASRAGVQYQQMIKQGKLNLRAGYQTDLFTHAINSAFGEVGWGGPYLGLEWVA